MSLVAELQVTMAASSAKLCLWQSKWQLPLPLPSSQLSVPPRPAHDTAHPAASPAAVAEPMADTFFEPYQEQHCNFCTLCRVRFPDDNQSINRHLLSTEHRGRVAALLPVSHSVLLFVSLFCWGRWEKTCNGLFHAFSPYIYTQFCREQRWVLVQGCNNSRSRPQLPLQAHRPRPCARCCTAPILYLRLVKEKGRVRTLAFVFVKF